MYSVNGDFGLVRLASMLPSQNGGLFSLNLVGWHKCNDRYHISRPDGGENHLILFTVSGCGAIQIEDTEYKLTAGTLAFIPRNTKCSYKTPRGGLWEFYWVHPSGECCEKFLDAVAQNGVYVKKREPSCRYDKRIEEILSLCTNHDSELYISQKLSDLLHLVAINLREKPKAVSLSSRVISYMEQHFRESIALEEIAATLFVSTAHLIRVFKKETGITPHQYLLKYRLMSAVQLLKFSDLRVEEIADQVGFSSSSHFISNFRREYGCTPMQYHEEQ